MQVFLLQSLLRENKPLESKMHEQLQKQHEWQKKKMILLIQPSLIFVVFIQISSNHRSVLDLNEFKGRRRRRKTKLEKEIKLVYNHHKQTMKNCNQKF